MVEFQVLRCSKCKTFQVMQVTKSPKWKCKLCAEKQSLIKSFGRGTGADCRRHVQKLNTLQGQIDETIEKNCLVSPRSFSNNVKSIDSHEENETDFKCLKESRWSHFMEGTQDEAEPVGDSMHCQHLALSTSDVSDFYKRNKRKRLHKRDGSPEKSANKFQEISDEYIGNDGLKTGNSVQWKHHPYPNSSINQTHRAVARGPGPRCARSAVESNTLVKTHGSPRPLSNIGRSNGFNSTRLLTLQGSSLKGQVDLVDHDPNLGDSHPADTDSVMVRSNQLKGQGDDLATCKNKTISKQKKERNLTEKVSLKWAAYVESGPSEEDDDDDDDEDFGKAYEGGFYSIVATSSRSDLNNAVVTILPAGEMDPVSTGTGQGHVNQPAGESMQHFIHEPVQNLTASTSSVTHQEGGCESEGVNFDLGYDD